MQQFLFLQHPDCRIRRTGARPRDANSFLSEDRRYCAETGSRNEKHDQEFTSHNFASC
jgi:hypothetical protein